MKALNYSLIVFLLFYGFSLTAQNSKYRVSSFDVDFGLHVVNNYFKSNFITDTETTLEYETVRGSFFQHSQASSSGAGVFNVSINLTPYSKKQNKYREQQSLRITAGYLTSNDIGVSGYFLKNSFRHDTLFIETTSAQNGTIESDTVYQDSVTHNYRNISIYSKVVKLGMQQLFSISTGLVTLSAGPGLNLNVGLGGTVEEYTTSYTSIDNLGISPTSNILEGSSLRDRKVSKINPLISLVPHVSLYIVKDAKERGNWFDNSSVYLSGFLGSQVTFSKGYSLAPSLVFGANVGIRYAF